MARVLHKLVALVAGALLGSAATTCGGGAYGPDCDGVRWAAERCFGPTRAINEEIACQSCAVAGRYNAGYFACFADHGDCSDTNDTETQTRIANCLNGKTPCEK